MIAMHRVLTLHETSMKQPMWPRASFHLLEYMWACFVAPGGAGSPWTILAQAVLSSWQLSAPPAGRPEGSCRPGRLESSWRHRLNQQQSVLEREEGYTF